MNGLKSRYIVSSICVTLLSLSGCQGWVNGGYPLQPAARVPAPGTSTYQVPSSYYNGQNAYNAQGVYPSSQGYPTNVAGVNAGGPRFSGPIAGTAQPNANVQPATFTAPVSPPTSQGTAGSLPPDLNWQN